MYFKFEDREKGKKLTFFSRQKKTSDNKIITFTDKVVYATLSESFKTGENNNLPVFTNDYWSADFCGKAYSKALNITEPCRVIITEFLVRNIKSQSNGKTYPQIIVFDFDLVEKG